ncbi:LysR family transcriptional regulator [Paracoccus sp. MKU1]|uniref:LysR family transcriptional regulator n=1 Tax=Paracoccus sp. MKU1 TaxID=1745182 RepID=UPI0007190AB3|nr:LysR family transcriptional regulator [Paracoccus sp. MKU1]KRW95242.1 hypothetical protein AQY21_15705 [Paracoccus sp. MKU1]
MSYLNLQKFDLNLMKVFLAIWDLQSVTAASERLGLTQPAVSHGLRRLRDHFGDPLFTRVGNAMMPTPTAAQLFIAFDRAMQTVGHSLQQQGRFDAATSTRVFRVAMSDVAEFYFLPALLAVMEAEAPSARLESVPLLDLGTEAALRAGQVDIALGFTPGFSEECQSSLLFHDQFVCLVRRDHPIRGSKLSKSEFSALTYVDVSTQAPGYRLIDQRLQVIGAVRLVTARLVHFTVAPEIVRHTDLATLYPRSAAERVNVEGAFRLLELPFDLPNIPISLTVHRNFADDRAIQWLAGAIGGLRMEPVS